MTCVWSGCCVSVHVNEASRWIQQKTGDWTASCSGSSVRAPTDIHLAVHLSVMPRRRPLMDSPSILPFSPSLSMSAYSTLPPPSVCHLLSAPNFLALVYLVYPSTSASYLLCSSGSDCQETSSLQESTREPKFLHWYNLLTGHFEHSKHKLWESQWLPAAPRWWLTVTALHRCDCSLTGSSYQAQVQGKPP